MPGIFGLPSFATYRATALHDTRTSVTRSVEVIRRWVFLRGALEIGSLFGLQSPDRVACNHLS